MMGTRSGDLDPSVMDYLCNCEHKSSTKCTTSSIKSPACSAFRASATTPATSKPRSKPAISKRSSPAIFSPADRRLHRPIFRPARRSGSHHLQRRHRREQRLLPREDPPRSRSCPQARHRLQVKRRLLGQRNLDLDPQERHQSRHHPDRRGSDDRPRLLQGSPRRPIVPVIPWPKANTSFWGMSTLPPFRNSRTS
jgi:hypothetical protein